MHSVAVTVAGERLMALAGGGLYWPDQGVLAVGDLHLGKALRLSRVGGGLLPPYEATETLLRLEALIRAADPAVVICVGDSFDDLAAADDIAEDARLWLLRLMAGRRWLWTLGNHDPGPVGLPGEHHDEVSIGALTFRHIALAGAVGEVSAHYHPKARIAAKRTSLTRPCFLIDETRVILPALGSLTGGLACHDPALAGLMGADALAILTGERALPIPMPR